MKVLVVGANGQIGKHLVNLLKDSKEHTVRAMVRKKEQAASFEKSGVEARLADLEGSVETIAEAAIGCDAVVFTAGSGGHTGADKTMLIDLDGAVKTIEAAEKVGAKRFIMVSGMHVSKRDKWRSYKNSYYMAAKLHADNFLEKSSLDYTIIRPGGLLNEPGTGKVEIAEALDTGSVPREDVAQMIVTTLSMENTYKRTFELITGEELIADALAKL